MKRVLDKLSLITWVKMCHYVMWMKFSLSFFSRVKVLVLIWSIFTHEIKIRGTTHIGFMGRLTCIMLNLLLKCEFINLPTAWTFFVKKTFDTRSRSNPSSNLNSDTIVGSWGKPWGPPTSRQGNHTSDRERHTLT